MTAGPAPSETPVGTAPRKPRKAFLLVGVVLAAALGIGLFTSLGSTKASSGAPHAGGPLPSFSGVNLNGAGQVVVPADGLGHGTAGVVLFFGNWCPSCHQELPLLAAAAMVGDLEQLLGTGSIDLAGGPTATGEALLRVTGSAAGSDLDITSGDFYFRGDPDAVFVNAGGTISKVALGPLTAATFTADERALTSSGR